MCGIAGYSGTFEPSLLAGMSALIAHRGPDGEGTWLDQHAGVGLAHRRLAILDLTSTGAQPMVSEDGSVAVVFNGEIYNHPALREELRARGFRFRGRSDTEVLLQAYLAWGEACFARFNGMFALAIWDGRTRETLLVRDPVGIKPLYWAEAPEGVLFASELKALLAHPGVSRAIDPVALQAYITFLWAPGTTTMLKAVRKLLPGHLLVIVDGEVQRVSRFADVPMPPPSFETATPEVWADRLRETLAAAVRRQLSADVEVGAFLSGGVDSSSVVALAARDRDPGGIRCYTIDLGERAVQEGFPDDLPYARRVADGLGVSLTAIRVDADVADHLSDLVWALDEPQADIAPLNVSLIAAAARADGVKVLLSGAGGDDVFSGYRRHAVVGLERWWSWLPARARAGLRWAARHVPVDAPALRRLRRLSTMLAATDGRRIVAGFDWADDEIRADLLHPDVRRAAGDAYAPLLDALSAYGGDGNALNRMLYLETKGFLPDHNLNYTDKMSMLHGVEVRVPFLDLEVIALGARIPPRLKQNGLVGKYILKQAMRGLLPAEVLRRAKSGFGAPVREWVRGPLRGMVRDRLTSAAFRARGWFDPGSVERLLAGTSAGRVDGAYVLWALVMIDCWAERFLGSSLAASEPELAMRRSRRSR
jgi:asparagine synthase (glutamine-hydrolysing)